LDTLLIASLHEAIVDEQIQVLNLCFEPIDRLLVVLNFLLLLRFFEVVEGVVMRKGQL